MGDQHIAVAERTAVVVRNIVAAEQTEVVVHTAVVAF